MTKEELKRKNKEYIANKKNEIAMLRVQEKQLALEETLNTIMLALADIYEKQL